MNDWSDDIPKEIVHDGQYKVRTAWFQAIVSDLDGALRNSDVDKFWNRWKAQKFIRKYTSDKFKLRELTTAKHINDGNSVINSVLND